MKTEYSNRLPHLAPVGAAFFVTFRLADALPTEVIIRMKEEYDAEIERLEKEMPANYVKLIQEVKQQYFGKFDQQLDNQTFGACYLKQPEVAAIIANKIKEYDGKYYNLHAYCIMPNHVHALFNFGHQISNLDEHRLSLYADNYVQLDKVMHLIKGGSAFQVNRLLGRSGKFWAKDSYDHYIRNEEEWLEVISYILNNPVKAGLVEQWEDWPGSYWGEGFGA